MKNIKLLKDAIDISFVAKEIKSAQEKKIIPLDYGLLERTKRKEARLIYLKKIEDNKKNNNVSLEIDKRGSPFFKKMTEFYGTENNIYNAGAWQYLVTTYRFKDQRDEILSETTSSFLKTTDLCGYFPKTLDYLKKFANEKSGVLQRIQIAVLLPGGEVRPHIDTGKYHNERERFHLVIQSKEGSEFTVGDEVEILKEGELWQINHLAMHSVKNLSNEPRIHIVFDLLPKDYFSLLEKIKFTIFNNLFQNYYDVFGEEKFSELIEKNKFLKKILLTW